MGVALAQAITTGHGSSATLAASLGGAPTPGNYMVLVAAWNSNATASVPSGWTSLGSTVNTGVSTTLQVFYRKVASGDSGSFSAPLSASSGWEYTFYELAGANGSTPFAGSVFNNANAATGMTLSATPSVSGSYPIAAFMSRQQTTDWGTAGYTSGWAEDAFVATYGGLQTSHGPTAGTSSVSQTVNMGAGSYYIVGALFFVAPAVSAPPASGLIVSSTRADFQSPNELAPQTVIVSNGLPPYAAVSSDTTVATVAQATSPNVWSDSDTLSSGSTLTNLAKASGGPNGATDAEATGSGSAIGANAILDRVVSVVMGQTYTPSFFIDPSQVTNNNGSTPNVLTEFAGSTQNADGSYSNVDGKNSATVYTFSAGTPFSVGASIAAGTSGAGGVRLGISDATGQNRYEIVDEEQNGGHNYYIAKIVNGAATAIVTPVSETADPGLFEPMGFTVTPGVPNTITAFVGGTSFSVTDSSLTLTSGSWHTRVLTNGNEGKVRNYAINSQVLIGINTADNLTQILQQYVAVNSTTAGRYATSAWTCPTNLAPHSDDLSTWAEEGSGGALGTGGPSGAIDWEVAGTGAAPGAYYELQSPVITVTPGQKYAPSSFVDPSQIVSGQAALQLFNPARTVGYFGVNIAAGPAGRYAGTWTCPAGVTQVVILLANNNCGIASGQKLKFSQPMLEPASSASGYYISSQNPQVHAYAELLSSAIVASGQKFKISQPMLAPSTYDPQTYIAQTAAFTVTPKYRGSASITYSDSTP